MCYRIPGQRRRTIDIAFLRPRVAVYIDGCFWHGCPVHQHLPNANAEWWIAKFAMNKARDTATIAKLVALGWTVLRFWEHEPLEDVASTILTRVRRAPRA